MVGSLDRSDGLEAFLDDCTLVSESVRARSRAHRVVSMIKYWCLSSSGDVDVKQERLPAEHTLQPAHEPYSHALPSHAAIHLPQPSGFSRPIGLYRSFCAGYCRLSEQEIKRYLWQARPIREPTAGWMSAMTSSTRTRRRSVQPRIDRHMVIDRLQT